VFGLWPRRHAPLLRVGDAAGPGSTASSRARLFGALGPPPRPEPWLPSVPHNRRELCQVAPRTAGEIVVQRDPS